jgi:transposase InsO family protein/transposase-like protein
MNKHYTQDEKELILNQYLCGDTITDIHRRSGISRSTLHNWINAYNENSNVRKPINMGDYNKLKSHCAKLENIISILKSAGCTVNAPLKERYAVIKEMSDTYSINTLCEALNVAKGSYYNHILRNKNENTLAAKRRAELTPVIEQIFNDNRQIYGAGKIAAILNDRGYHVAYTTVASIMHENGWFSIRSSAKTLYLQNKSRKENILNQEFNPQRTNEVWVSDVTYFKYNNKTFYICVIIDLFARKVIACRISMKNSTQLTKSTFKIAYESRNTNNELLFHSDNGSNYISKTFMKYLNTLGVKQSFSRAHVPYDNSVCESFFGNMKREELYRTNYKSENELKESIKKYIEFYNSERPHSMLRYRTPDKAEADFFNNHATIVTSN